MNSEMQKRLYELEVMPPLAVWEKLSSDIDELNDDRITASKLFNLELTPPATALDKIFLEVDEFNEDNRIAKKILATELTPPNSVWEKIDSTINTPETEASQKRGIVIHFKKLAAAAILIGVIATAWILISNKRNSNSVSETLIPAETSSSKSNGITEQKDPVRTENYVAESTGTAEKFPRKAENFSPKKQTKNIKSYGTALRNKNDLLVEPTTAQYAVLNTPSGKNFDRPIDDLALVTSDDNYMTMVNANGRLVKIPAQFASLAPHLQDKPIAEDYYEIMFGEGTYWKATLDEWRRKIASAPGTTGDAFTSFVELLKSVQNR